MEARKEKIQAQENKLKKLKEDLEKTKGWNRRKTLRKQLDRIRQELNNSHKTITNCERQIAKINRPLSRLDNEVSHWQELSSSFARSEEELIITPMGERFREQPTGGVGSFESEPLPGSRFFEENPEAQYIRPDENEIENEEKIEKTIYNWRDEVAKMTLGGKKIVGGALEVSILSRRGLNHVFEDIIDIALDKGMDNNEKRELVLKKINSLSEGRGATQEEKMRLQLSTDLILDQLLPKL